MLDEDANNVHQGIQEILYKQETIVNKVNIPKKTLNYAYNTLLVIFQVYAIQVVQYHRFLMKVLENVFVR